jgi:hypothetical protein
MTAYMVFMRQLFREHKGADPKETIRRGSAQWKALPSSERLPFERAAREDSVRYENDMRQWQLAREAMVDAERA